MVSFTNLQQKSVLDRISLIWALISKKVLIYLSRSPCLAMNMPLIDRDLGSLEERDWGVRRRQRLRPRLTLLKWPVESQLPLANHEFFY